VDGEDLAAPGLRRGSTQQGRQDHLDARSRDAAVTAIAGITACVQDAFSGTALLSE